jgi:MFS transporter, UMF1 family
MFTMSETKDAEPTASDYASKPEIAAWAMYDVANSTYTTVVTTAVYNAYFVGTVAAPLAVGEGNRALPTLLLSAVVCVSSLLVVVSAPVIGTIADATARKKLWLFCTTAVCVVATAGLYFTGRGDYALAVALLGIANTAYFTGENLIAAFLPELAPAEKLGRISAYGWSAGYVGGLGSLALALAYLKFVKAGQPASESVPMVMLMTAGLFAAAATPTFIWLKERAKPDETIAGVNYIRVGFERLGRTVERARHYRDLFAVLIAILVFQCGVGTVVNLAAVYSQEVLKFTAEDSLIMILVVNITAAIGAFIFGFLQDRIGSVRTLCITMLIWLVAIGMAYFATQKRDLWIAANAVGLAMGSSGSAGRALVSKFSPRGRSGEFLGLWGVAVKLATAIGVLAFGIVSYVTSDYRVALLFTGVFFAAGFVLVLRIDEQRGIEASKT